MNTRPHTLSATLALLAVLAAGCHAQRARAELAPAPARTAPNPADADARRIATHRSFHDNGNPALLFHTDSNGHLHGPYRSWFPNGQLHIERHYNHGWPDGLVTERDSEGNVVHQQRWFGGVPVN